MLRNRQVILLYLQFFICHVLSKEAISDTTNLTLTSGWKCNSNDDCTATNSMCLNNLCQCASEYIFNADMTSCLKVATGLYDSCEDTVQCSAYLLSGAKCFNKVCVCGPGYYYLHGRCNPYVGLYEKCKYAVDCYVFADFEASYCDGGICKCSPGFYQREYRTCRREGKKPGDECTIKNDCTFGNAMCTTFKCRQSQSAQVIKTIEFVFDAEIITNNLDADKEIRVGSNCTSNDNCLALGNAVCSPATGTCRCNRAHFASPIGTKCIPELGESCQKKGEESYIEKSFCREGTWSCANGTVASNNNRECLKVTRNYNGKCKYNEQCHVFGPDAVCSSNDRCVCNETISHYVKSELFCWINKGVGETCKHNQDCYVKDFQGKLMCKSNVCSCPDGARLSRNKMRCINGGAELGGICEEHDDCTSHNSVCEKGVCSCAKSYYELNKQCLAGINSTCDNNEDCTPKNSICNSNVCSCEPNYVSVAINSCMPISSYGEPCMLDIQCFNVSGAICASTQIENAAREFSETADRKVCTCREDSYYKLQKCFKKRFLGESCTNLDDCYESLNPHQQSKIICKNGKCSCDWGYKKWNSSLCVIDQNAAAFFLNSSTTIVTSTELFSIILFILLCKLL